MERGILYTMPFADNTVGRYRSLVPVVFMDAGWLATAAGRATVGVARCDQTPDALSFTESDTRAPTRVDKFRLIRGLPNCEQALLRSSGRREGGVRCVSPEP